MYETDYNVVLLQFVFDSHDVHVLTFGRILGVFTPKCPLLRTVPRQLQNDIRKNIIWQINAWTR